MYNDQINNTSVPTSQNVHEEMNHFPQKNTENENSETMMTFLKSAVFSFLQHMQEFKENIESSKITVRYLLEQIRQQGHVNIKRDDERNLSPDANPSDIYYTFNQQENPKEKFYPSTRIDKTFEAERRNKILKQDDQFKERMNKSVEESLDHDSNDHITWKRSNHLNSFQYIGSIINKFQSMYNQQKNTDFLDKDFMFNTNPSKFIINGNILHSNNNETMLKDFQELIPDGDFQKLISTYANQRILNDAFSYLPVTCPELQEYDFKNFKNIYKINNLDNGLMKIVVTHLADVDIKNTTSDKKYHSCGVRATVIVSPFQTPIIKYTYFVE